MLPCVSGNKVIIFHYTRETVNEISYHGNDIYHLYYQTYQLSKSYPNLILQIQHIDTDDKFKISIEKFLTKR